MPKLMKNVSKAKHSSSTSTPNKAKFVSRKSFNTVKDRKNRALYFIATLGMLGDFLNFEKEQYNRQEMRTELKQLYDQL